MDLICSELWERADKEDEKAFQLRILSQKKQFKAYMRQHGRCYLVKFEENDIRPIWEDQIDIVNLIKELHSPMGSSFDCPLCQPYDIWDNVVTQYTGKNYLTKIVNPKYEDGFIDKGGVWLKCPCLVKGEDRHNFKFKKRVLI